jgi:hypothetical protein
MNLIFLLYHDYYKIVLNIAISLIKDISSLLLSHFLLFNEDGLLQ